MKLLYSTEEVSARVDEMARQIVQTYTGNKPVFVCLLRGGVPFASQLAAAIARRAPDFHPELEYLHVSAYGSDRTAGVAQTYSGIDASRIAGRDVVVLDDCLDQGVTYTHAKQYLLEHGASSVGLVVLADKDVSRDGVEPPLIAGFKTPNVWLVGMGMDDAGTAPEAERWAGYIGDVSA